METYGKVWRLVSRMWAGHGCFREEVPPAEDEPELLELDRAAELYQEAGIPLAAAGGAEGRQVGLASKYPGSSSRAPVCRLRRG